MFRYFFSELFTFLYISAWVNMGLLASDVLQPFTGIATFLAFSSIDKFALFVDNPLQLSSRHCSQNFNSEFLD